MSPVFKGGLAEWHTSRSLTGTQSCSAGRSWRARSSMQTHTSGSGASHAAKALKLSKPMGGLQPVKDVLDQCPFVGRDVELPVMAASIRPLGEHRAMVPNDSAQYGTQSCTRFKGGGSCPASVSFSFSRAFAPSLPPPPPKHIPVSFRGRRKHFGVCLRICVTASVCDHVSACVLCVRMCGHRVCARVFAIACAHVCVGRACVRLSYSTTVFFLCWLCN